MTLNRRHFLKSLAAVGALPALPAMPAAASVSAAHTKMQMLWATTYAQMNNACSVAQIQSALQVSPAVSQSIHRELLARGVLLPTSLGHHVARNPVEGGGLGHRPRQTTGRRTRWTAADARRLMRIVTRDIPRQLPFRPINRDRDVASDVSSPLIALPPSRTRDV